MTNFQNTEDPRFAKDVRSSAIINIDTKGYQKFKMERERIMQVQHLAQQVETLQDDVGDIKRMLQQLINGK